MFLLYKLNDKIASHIDCGCVYLTDKVLEVFMHSFSYYNKIHCIFLLNTVCSSVEKTNTLKGVDSTSFNNLLC